MEEEQYLADALFFSLVEISSLPPDESLASLSGHPSSPPPYATTVIRRCEEAWSTPLRSLTCEQVKSLLVQRMGLEWLGRPLLDFVTRQPAAMVLNYPGDMSLGCLRAAQELSDLAPVELRAWLRGDFGWIVDAFAWDEEGRLLDEAQNTLAAARALIRLQ